MSDTINYSASIPMHILTSKKLSSTDKLVYTIVNGLSKKNGDCWASNTYIANQLDIKKDTVSKIISKLVDLGYMKRKEFRDENNQVVKRLLSTFHVASSLLPDFNSIPLSENDETPIGEKSDTSSKEVLLYTEDYNSKDINTNVYTAKSKKKGFVPPTLDEVKVFFRDNGYSEEVAIRAFKHYEDNDWKDSYNNKVLNWKSKVRNNWFKDQYKIQESKIKVRDIFGGTHLKTQDEINKAEPGFFNKI